MRIVSLVPHATELLFALVGRQMRWWRSPTSATTRPRRSELPRVTRDVLPAGLSAGEIDRAVRERTLEGRAIYELDREALAALEPELIVTQALCPVCAVSYEEVAELAAALPSRPRVIALDPSTLEETLADVTTVAAATGHLHGAPSCSMAPSSASRASRELSKGRPRPRRAPSCSEKPRRASSGSRRRCGDGRDRGWRRSSGSTRCMWPATGRPS